MGLVRTSTLILLAIEAAGKYKLVIDGLLS